MHCLEEFLLTRIAMEMPYSFYPLSDQNGTFLLVPLLTRHKYLGTEFSNNFDKKQAVLHYFPGK